MHPVASYDTLFNQAQISAKEYLDSACEYLDSKFGVDYAAQNPNLVGHLTLTMAIDCATSVFQQKVDRLSSALCDLTASTQ